MPTYGTHAQAEKGRARSIEGSGTNQVRNQTLFIGQGRRLKEEEEEVS